MVSKRTIASNKLAIFPITLIREVFRDRLLWDIKKFQRSTMLAR